MKNETLKEWHEGLETEIAMSSPPEIGTQVAPVEITPTMSSITPLDSETSNPKIVVGKIDLEKENDKEEKEELEDIKDVKERIENEKAFFAYNILKAKLDSKIIEFKEKDGEDSKKILEVIKALADEISNAFKEM